MSESPQVSQGSQQPLSRRARREAAGDTGFRLNAIPFLIIGILVVLITAFLLWWFLGREEEPEPIEWTWVEDPADGVHARGVPPEDWEAGWCLSGYTDEETPADVMDCERSYDVQVLLQDELDDEITEGAYPGDDVVSHNANLRCEEIALSSSAIESLGAELQREIWYPTEDTWNNEDDRLVSCFLTRADGGSLRGDFLDTSDDDPDDDEEEVEIVDEQGDDNDDDAPVDEEANEDSGDAD